MREEASITRGLLDTSVIIDLEKIAEAQLPDEMAICSITLAELSAGPHATEDPAERANRQDRLQRVETVFEPLGFGLREAQAYGRAFALVAAAGRKPRTRLADLLIAAVAAANGLPLYTRNPKDFIGLEQMLKVIAV